MFMGDLKVINLDRQNGAFISSYSGHPLTVARNIVPDAKLGPDDSSRKRLCILQ